MNIQIDTTNKVIRLTEKVGFKELENVLMKLFPNNEWREYTLDTNTTVTWTNPIVIRENPYRYYPWRYNVTNVGLINNLEYQSGTTTQSVYNLSIE